MRGILLSCLALACAAPLGGCGFTPLYAQPADHPSLTHIDVVAPQGRVGYLLREDLDDAFGHDKGAPAAYKLEMQLGQSREAHGLTVNNVAQRYQLDMTVNFTLTDLATGKVAYTGSVWSAVSYDSAAQPYAGIAARQDTQDRLASVAAQKIQLQLDAWMARGAPEQPPAPPPVAVEAPTP
jgi:LPS-assembly lipoprotein